MGVWSKQRVERVVRKANGAHVRTRGCVGREVASTDHADTQGNGPQDKISAARAERPRTLVSNPKAMEILEKWGLT